jgi:LmbE family N-acetylglucosaminyl deacetylase
MEWFTNPTFVIDITKTFSKKLEALNAYASQLQQDYIRRIEARDRLYGSFIQVEYGEPLCNSTPLKIPSLSTFLWR